MTLRFPLLMLLLAAGAAAQDWPQFLGPTRDGVYAGKLPGLKPAWKRDVGQGFSGPVAVGGKVMLFHRLADKETIECLDARTGRPVWTYGYPTEYRDDFGFDEGPRGTPAIADGRVYAFGAEGMLHCLDLASGKKRWSVDTRRKFGSAKGFFGAASSPLVEDGLVLLNVGGPKGAGVAAFDAETGETRWSATNDEAGYAAPVAVSIGGMRHALFFTRNGLVDVDPAKGEVRWEFPWRSRSHASVNAAAPLVIGDLVFISASYGTGAALLKVGEGKPARVWASDEAMSNHYATSVHRDGVLYGYHGRQEFRPSLRAVEVKTGKVLWSVDGFGAGTVTLAGDQLVLLKENGELAIAAASPQAFRPAVKVQALPGTVRAYPALADGRLYARNEKTLVCLE
ncbi:MAG: PQQ-like beta-propeller repeat protein [Bryobacteraceae bacterium]|nr:PQQ-like beta-propeller repeat protein [Bryobacteraceae bacterium]